MRVVFMGTPALAVPSLDALVEAGFEVPLVVAQPDRPAGRGSKVPRVPAHGDARVYVLPERPGASPKG